MNSGVVFRCRWILAVILAGFVFAPMILFDMTSVRLPDSQKSLDYPTVICLSSPTYDMSQDAADLYAWLAVASPMAGAHPDYNGGFSKYGYPYDSMELSTLPEFSMKDVPTPSRPGLEAIENAGNLDVVEMSGHSWKQYQFDLNDIPQVAAAKVPEGGYWRFADGSLMENAPQIPQEIIDLLSSEIESVVCPGCYEISAPNDRSMMPYVILRRGCGSARLDQAARQILWSYATNNPQIAELGKLIEIDWRGGKK